MDGGWPTRLLAFAGDLPPSSSNATRIEQIICAAGNPIIVPTVLQECLPIPDDGKQQEHLKWARYHLAARGESP